MLKKFIIFSCVMILSVSFMGCQKVTHYSLSEQMVNHFLQSETDDYRSRFNTLENVEVIFSFDKLLVDIGRDDEKRMSAVGMTKAEIVLPEGEKYIDIVLQLTGQPHFNRKLGAVYLDAVNVDYYQVKSDKALANTSEILPHLNQAIQQYFQQNPIYVLDKSSAIEAQTLETSSQLSVEKGRLIFTWL